MNKEKLLQAGIWISAFSVSIIFCALSLYIGFNNQRHGDSTILIIGYCLIPVVFYCIYRGLKLVIDSIFHN